MSTLKNEVVAESSPWWVGFQHFLLFGVLFLVFGFVLQIIGIPFDNFFGFYFADFWQEFRLVVTATFLAILASSLLLRRKTASSKDPRKVLVASVAYFVSLNLLILGSLYFGDQTPHYGSTGRDELPNQLLFSVISSVEYYFFGKLLLKATPKS